MDTVIFIKRFRVDGDKTPDVQSFVDDLIKKQNDKDILEDRYNTYGAVKLKDGSILNIRTNFFYLDQMWQTYNIYKNQNDDKNLKKFLNKTNGGIFDSGDIMFLFEDVSIMFRSQYYEKLSEEEKQLLLFRKMGISDHLEGSFYGYDFDSGPFSDTDGIEGIDQ